MSGNSRHRPVLGFPIVWMALVALELVLVHPVEADEPADNPPSMAADAAALPTSAPARLRKHLLLLSQLGLTDEQRVNATEGELTLTFKARTEEILAEATLTLDMVPTQTQLPRVQALVITLNGETVDRIPLVAGSPEHSQMFRFRLPPDLLAARNTIGLRFTGGVPRQGCFVVPRGTWKVVRAGTLVVTSRRLPLPDDLGLLPVPFLDPQFDHTREVKLVFARPPVPATIEAAARVASWLGLFGVPAVQFRTQVAELPDDDAVLIVDRPEDSRRLGLSTATGPRVTLMPHPGDPANLKLLVISGNGAREVQLAAAALAHRWSAWHGASVAVSASDAAPLPVKRSSGDTMQRITELVPLVLAKLAPARALLHRGTRDGSMLVRFRMVPDVFIWPAETIDFDVHYRERYLEGMRPPRVDAEINGRFLGALPAVASGKDGRVRLKVHRSLLRGYNELRFHVTYQREPEAGKAGQQACVEERPADAELRVLGDSTLQLGGMHHFRQLPDLVLFLYDGYPFTRRPDLGEMAAVLPAQPQPREVDSLLSIVAAMAGVTGKPGTGLVVMDPHEVLACAELDRDVLLVGAAYRQPLVREWIDRSPLQWGPNGFSLRPLSRRQRLLRLLQGDWRMPERADARERLRDHDVAAAIGFESPLRPGRSVVAVTATATDILPEMKEMQAYAVSREPRADVLLLTERGRYLFRLGRSYTTGQLQFWLRSRWWLATFWVALLIVLPLAAWVLAWLGRRALTAKAQRRLAEAK